MFYIFLEKGDVTLQINTVLPFPPNTLHYYTCFYCCSFSWDAQFVCKDWGGLLWQIHHVGQKGLSMAGAAGGRDIVNFEVVPRAMAQFVSGFGTFGKALSPYWLAIGDPGDMYC